MDTHEGLRAFLGLAEMSAVGSAQERAAFVAIHIERRTVREAGRLIGVSKSQVSNLAALFLQKLATKMMDLERKRLPVSKEYLELRGGLIDQLRSLQEESGSRDDREFDDGLSREDWAEMTGTPLRDPDQ